MSDVATTAALLRRRVEPAPAVIMDPWPRRTAYARFGYAAAALLAPRLAARALGVRASEMTPAAVAWAAGRRPGAARPVHGDRPTRV